MAISEFERVTVTSRKEWRAWLAANHRRTESIWLVTYKKGDGRPYLPYADIVDEALCFGWIDSRPSKLDEARTMLLLSPRRDGSAWSAVNKAKIRRLVETGRMTSAGQEKIDRAKLDGSWDRLETVDMLIIPDDLASALAATPKAAARFAAFSPSSRRGILEWILSAKRPETRQKRIAETASLAAQNIKANHPTGRRGEAQS